jgi:PAS domain S-box-containing protein
MSWVTVIWAMVVSVCLTLGTIHLLIWFRERRSWAYLCFFVLAVGVIGMAAGELAAMYARSPTEYGAGVRWGHFAYGFIAVGSLGFVHFYFGTGKRWLLGAALGLRLLAVVVNFSTGLNLHIGALQSLQVVNFLGEPVAMLGQWTANPWVRLGQLAALAQVVYVVDASFRLWRTGGRESRRRAVMVGGTLAFFILFASAQAGLVAVGVLRMPMIVSFPFLAVLLAMGYELSRDVLRAAQLSDDLRASEERMSLAAEAAGFGVWTWNFPRNRVWGSERWLGLFGFAPDATVTFESVMQRIHPDDRKMVEGAVQRAVADRGDYAGEYRVILPDGAQRWISARGRGYADTNRKPAWMMGAALDITERKRTEEASRSAHELMAAVFNSVPGLLYLYTEDGRLVQWNRQHEEMTGYTAEELLNFRVEDWFDEEDRIKLAQEFPKIFSEGYTQVELNLILKNKQKMPIFATGSKVIIDGKPHMVGIAIDISVRKKAEELLRTSEARYRDIFEGAIEGIFRSSLQGEIMAANPALAKMLGYDSPEDLVRTVRDSAKQVWADVTERSQFVRLLEERGVVHAYECQFKRKDGASIWVSLSSRVVREATGRVACFEGFIADITERKRAELELQAQREALAHVGRVSALGQLASSLAHELNQPLGAILRNAEAAELFLQDPSPDLEEVRAILADIRKDDQRAGAVIDRMRAFMKRRDIERLPHDFNLLAGEVVAMVRPDAEVHRVRLTLETDPALPPVHGDEVQLQQVLLNLLLNAMDAVSANRPDNRLIAVRAWSVGSTVEVSVSDNGQGIPADNLPRVFEPFFTSKPNGLGMGLAISRGIIEAHGGRLRVENNATGGATFHFTLPVSGDGAGFRVRGSGGREEGSGFRVQDSGGKK